MPELGAARRAPTSDAILPRAHLQASRPSPVRMAVSPARFHDGAGRCASKAVPHMTGVCGTLRSFVPARGNRAGKDDPGTVRPKMCPGALTSGTALRAPEPEGLPLSQTPATEVRANVGNVLATATLCTQPSDRIAPVIGALCASPEAARVVPNAKRLLPRPERSAGVSAESEGATSAPREPWGCVRPIGLHHARNWSLRGAPGPRLGAALGAGVPPAHLETRSFGMHPRWPPDTGACKRSRSPPEPPGAPPWPVPLRRDSTCPGQDAT
jgi:hypothetical protein